MESFFRKREPMPIEHEIVDWHAHDRSDLLLAGDQNAAGLPGIYLGAAAR
jgi:hypothetical protein